MKKAHLKLVHVNERELELRPNELLAEHLGTKRFLVADLVADMLKNRGHDLTSGDRCMIAAVVGNEYEDDERVLNN